MTVDGDGAVLNKSTYLPYGKRVPLQGSTPGVFGFNDKREENQGDLVYYGARYYDPVVRQFISPDPLRLQGADDVLDGNSLQPYVYAGANPTTFADDGRMICSGSQCPDSWTATLSISTMGVGGLLSGVVGVGGSLLTTIGSEVSAGASSALTALRALPLAAKIALEVTVTKSLDGIIQSYLAAKKADSGNDGEDAEADSDTNADDTGTVETPAERRTKAEQKGGGKTSRHINAKRREVAGQRYEAARREFRRLKSEPIRNPRLKKQIQQAQRQMDHWKRKMDETGDTDHLDPKPR